MIKFLIERIKKAKTSSLSDRGNRQLKTVVLLVQFAAALRVLLTAHSG